MIELKIQQIVNSVFNSNTFILTAEGSQDCWIVDVGDTEPIWGVIGNRELKGVFLTHTHYDHIYGINKLIERYPACLVYTSLRGKEGLFSDKLNFSRYHADSIIFQGDKIHVLEDGDKVQLFPNVTLHVLYTPGHDWSCMSYYTDDVIFTGDSYIPNVKVITSFPKSNKNDAVKSINNIQKLMKTRRVFPGHLDCEIGILE